MTKFTRKKIFEFQSIGCRFSIGGKQPRCVPVDGIAIIVVMLFVLLQPSAFAYEDPLDTPALNLPSAAVYSLLLDLSQINGRLVAVGERGHILYSNDNGLEWKQADVPAMAHLTALSFPTPEKGWAVGNDTVILHTNDGGKTWVHQYDERNSDFPTPLFDVLFLNDREGFAIGGFGKSLRTTDGGQTWMDWTSHIDNPDEWHLNAITVNSEGVMFIAGEAGFVYRSTDRGHSFIPLDVPHDGSLLGIVTTKDPNQAFAFGIGGYLFTTGDGGNSWHSIDSGTQSGLAGGTLLSDGSVIIVGGDGIILKTKRSTSKFVAYRRPDRLPMSSVIQSQTGDFITVGFGGVNRIEKSGLDALIEAGGAK